MGDDEKEAFLRRLDYSPGEFSRVMNDVLANDATYVVKTTNTVQNSRSPATQTCHPAEVAAWEAEAPFRRGERARPEARAGYETCHFWDIRARECRYEMLFLGCEPCKACPG